MRKIWLIGGVILGCGVLAAMIVTYRRVHRLISPYNDRQISGPLVVTGEWVEIKPKKPLTMDNPVQEIVMEMDRNIRVDVDNWNLVLPDGSLASPEVQLVDQSGNVYPMPIPSASKSEITQSWTRGFRISIEAHSRLPSTTVFPIVRVRSDLRISCSKIFWRTYNPEI